MQHFLMRQGSRQRTCGHGGGALSAAQASTPGDDGITFARHDGIGYRQALCFGLVALFLAGCAGNRLLDCQCGGQHGCHGKRSQNAAGLLGSRNGTRRSGRWPLNCFQGRENDSCCDVGCGCSDCCSEDWSDASCEIGCGYANGDDACCVLDEMDHSLAECDVDRGDSMGVSGAPGCSSCRGRGCGLCRRIAGRAAEWCPHAGGYPARQNFHPSPPTGQVAYPYYTVRGPRDFLRDKPPSIGPY